MATAGITGIYGDVKIGSAQISEIEQWDFNPKAKNGTYISNMTAGYQACVAGSKSGTGTMKGVWGPAIPATTVIDVATAVVLKLYIGAASFYQVTSVIDDFKLSVDLSGEIVGWTASFTANGAWVNPIAGAPVTLEEEDCDQNDYLWCFDSPLQHERDLSKLILPNPKVELAGSGDDRVLRASQEFAKCQLLRAMESDPKFRDQVAALVSRV